MQGVVQTMTSEGSQSPWLLTGTSRGHLTLWDMRFHIPLTQWDHPSKSPIEALAYASAPAGSMLAAFCVPMTNKSHIAFVNMYLPGLNVMLCSWLLLAVLQSAMAYITPISGSVAAHLLPLQPLDLVHLTLAQSSLYTKRAPAVNTVCQERCALV